MPDERSGQLLQPLPVRRKFRHPPQRLARAAAVDALVAGVEAPQRGAHCRVIPGHRRWQREAAQPRAIGQYLLRWRGFVIGGQIESIPRGPLHRRDDHRCQILHVQPVEHQPGPHHMAGAALGQLQQRIAARTIQRRQPEYRRGDAARIGQPTPLRFCQAPLHTRRFAGIGHAVLVDPATAAVTVHRGRGQIAHPAQGRAGLQGGQQHPQGGVTLRIGRHAAEYGRRLCDGRQQFRRRRGIGMQAEPPQSIVGQVRRIACRANHLHPTALQPGRNHAPAPAHAEDQQRRRQRRRQHHALRSAW